MRTVQLKITGMNYKSNAGIVENALEEMGGVRSAYASFHHAEVTIEYDERLTSPEQLKLAVMGAGYTAENAIPA
jgi:copper chaperone